MYQILMVAMVTVTFYYFLSTLADMRRYCRAQEQRRKDGEQ